jgi:senataxin
MLCCAVKCAIHTQGGGYPVKMLNMQYRMHPDISIFPSRQFYSGNLLDGEVRKESRRKTD